MSINKSDVKVIFGGTIQGVANAVGITKQAVSQWNEHLIQDQQDRAIGAAIRLGIAIPPEIMSKFVSGHLVSKDEAA